MKANTATMEVRVQDEAGEVFAVDIVDGAVWGLVDNSGGSTTVLPQKLSQTGLFVNTAQLTPASGVVEYGLNSPLWSDSAAKRRWFAIPNGKKIKFSETGYWTFPKGTVFVKNFELTLNDGTRRRVETRVIVNFPSGWAGFTYKWNTAGTDADLSVSPVEQAFVIKDNHNVTRNLTWHYPGTTECNRCHTTVSGFVQGFRTSQVNRDGQLNRWNSWSLFTTNIGPESGHAKRPDPQNSQIDVGLRARSYLATNCSMCHQPGGPAAVDIDFRYETPISRMGIMNVPPTAGGLGLSSPRRLAPGSKERSVIWERMRRTDDNRMPPLATQLPDTNAISVIGRWIDRF